MYARFLCLLLMAGCLNAQVVESVQRLWGEAPHSAFGDLIRFQNRWVCVFREGLRHVANKEVLDDGKIRVISSVDGKSWESLALVEESGTDLRDPHLSITADGRLMLVMGGSLYPKGVYAGRMPRVAFSKDGRTWTQPRKVLREGDWLWRVTWHEGWAYGVAKYGSPSKTEPGNPRRTDLVRSRDGLHWEKVVETKVDGGDETTVRFQKDGTMIMLMRRTWGEKNTAQIGRALPPYTQWEWKDAGTFIGGPNFIVLPDGRMFAGGRYFRKDGTSDAVTALAALTPSSYQVLLQLPSSGDSSYPGFVWHENRLWMSYYSSHEGKAAIYLAKIRLD
ncbi:MAG: exo-alpha-sialidase [Candidatus Solibacter usitatus]|nr:exo-alpha-sialidase [Candidatus Solibacter usitatus]